MTFTSRLVSFWWTSCQYSHRPWTALGRIHPASASDELQHLLVGFAGVWHVTQREDLPQQYSKWPAGGESRSRTELTITFIIMCNTLNLACSLVPQTENTAINTIYFTKEYLAGDVIIHWLKASNNKSQLFAYSIIAAEPQNLKALQECFCS